MNTTTHRDNGETTYDTLTSAPAVTIKARNIKEGMVLLDPELHTPYMVVDHRVSAARRSGDVAFLVLNLESRRYETLTINPTTEVPAMAA